MKSKKPKIQSESREAPWHLEYISKAKDKNDPFRLMGFGHRVYKNHDPRATIIKRAAYDVFDVTGKNPERVGRSPDGGR